VTVELTLEAAKQLSGVLARAIAAAEIDEGGRLRDVRPLSYAASCSRIASAI
jgi:hypothetical protein